MESMYVQRHGGVVLCGFIRLVMFNMTFDMFKFCGQTKTMGHLIHKAAHESTTMSVDVASRSRARTCQLVRDR